MPNECKLQTCVQSRVQALLSGTNQSSQTQRANSYNIYFTAFVHGFPLSELLTCFRCVLHITAVLGKET